MGSIIGRESDEVARLEALIREVLESESDADLRSTLRRLFASLDSARENYWRQAGELRRMRESLKASG